MMNYQQPHKEKKILPVLLLGSAFIFLSAFTGTTTLDYTRTLETPPTMPKGDPDPSLGIVIKPNSNGLEILADSSQNVRFTVFTYPAETDNVVLLRSSSRFEYTPKKITFLDEKNGFSSDNIYEFSVSFNYENYQWDSMRFMPFPSVIEWVTKEKLIAYLTTWANLFEKAGWEREKNPPLNQHDMIENFLLPTSKHNGLSYCCSWDTDEYEAVIQIDLRNKEQYKRSYVPKKERKKITFTPDGYIAFIIISKKSQYPTIYNTNQKKKVKK
jgi:hypothetical protein